VTGPRLLEDEAATEAAGAELARLLGPGDLVLLTGPLGAGKSTFVRGAARALGVPGLVQSPTFVVGRSYTGSGGPVHHLDLYRFAERADDEDWAALEPYFSEGAIVFVEWPEAALGRWPRPPRARVRLDHARAGARPARTLRVDLDGDPGA
jgi:tRNA threonylcarbamoyladenosine biosynthesis protein TsaE